MLVRDSGHQRGATLPLVAVVIVVLLGCAALAIDMGLIYTARTSAQHAADAAALAGAFSFVTNATAPQPDTATNAAIAVGQTNSILGEAVTIAGSDVVVDVPNRRVTVTVRRVGTGGIATNFARMLGIDRVDVLAQATAEAGLQAVGSRCVKPVFMPNTIVSNLDPAVACANGEVLFDANRSLTSLGLSKVGQQLQIRPDNPENALTPGHFYSLDFGSGADDYRCALGNCLNECFPGGTDVIRCGDRFPVKTGNMVGPTNQGIRDLVGDPPDEWVAVGQYRDGDGNIWDTSRSLAIVPVWDNCAQAISPGYHGQQVEVIGFAELFFDGQRGSWVVTHLVNATGCAEAGSPGSTDPGTGPYGFPVRLVQNPN